MEETFDTQATDLFSALKEQEDKNDRAILAYQEPIAQKALLQISQELLAAGKSYEDLVDVVDLMQKHMTQFEMNGAVGKPCKK